MRAARVDRDDDAIRMGPAHVREKRIVERRARADHRPSHTGVQRRLHGSEVTQAPTRFDRYGGHRRDDLADERRLLRRSRERSIEIHDVETFGAERRPVHGHRHRIVREHGFGVGAPFTEPDTAPVAKIDGGNDDHSPPFTSAAKFSRRRRPHR